MEGIDKMVANAQRVKGRTHDGARKGLGLAGRNTLNVSNSQVPHEEGDLERDGGVSVDGERLRSAISYGRSADTAKYAVDQHENLTYHHDSGRNAKFLENALNSTRAQNLTLLGKSIKGEMGT